MSRISTISVGKKELSFGRAVKPLAIVERTKTRIDAEGGDGSETILQVSLIETDKGTTAMFTRMYVADVSAPCADTFSVSMKR